MDSTKLFYWGILLKTPEIRYTPNGTAVANFALAVNRRFKQEGILRMKSVM